MTAVQQIANDSCARQWPAWSGFSNIALVVLLAATLFHAVRLERALGVLKRDRVAVGGAGRRLQRQHARRRNSASSGCAPPPTAPGSRSQRQIDAALSLKDDLTLLIERGDRLADRLDALVRAGRPLASRARRA